MTNTQGLFRDNLTMAGRLSARLARSADKLRPLFPIAADQVDAFDDATQESVDAFLKRFEQLVDLIEHRLFRGLALLEGEDIAEASKRDISRLMEKLGVLPDAHAWSACSMLRNKLAHDYPDAPGLRAERMNAAHAAVPLVRQTLERLVARARSRGLVEF